MDAASTCSVTQVYAALQVFGCLDLIANMCPKDTIVHDSKSFFCHYIVVGAGTSGSVIANRLTENPKYQVCLIEAGGDPPLEAAIPALFSYTHQRNNFWDYKYEVDPENPTFHEENVSPLSLPKMLGGNGNLNYLYERGDPSDYDDWADHVKDKSWNYENVLRSFIKSERLYDAVINHSDHQKYHGTDGFLGVSKQYCPRINKYLDAFREIGHKELVDFSGRNVTGYGRVFLNLANNVHQTGTFSYITPILERKNLKVLKHSTVTHVTVNKKKKANGVCIVGRDQKKICIRAKKEVILAAGAINTAKILLQSGVGPKHNLHDNNIKCLSDLPVGKNLMVQRFIPIFQQTEVMTQPPENYGLYYYPIPLVLGRISIDTTSPQYKSLTHVLSPALMLQHCKHIYGLAENICQNFYNQAAGREILITQITPFKLKSRGSVELRSSNYLDAPIIRNAFISDNDDIDITLRYIKDYRRIYTSTYFSNTKARILNVPRCPSDDSDEEIKCIMKGMVSSHQDHYGTCAMGSVVNSKLQVFGIERLRVADSAVIPVPISAELYVTNVMIGEKAAEIIIEDDRQRNGVSSKESDDSSKSKESKENSKESKEKSRESKENSKESKEKSKESKEKSKESKEKAKKDKKKHKKDKHSKESKEKSKEKKASGSSSSED